MSLKEFYQLLKRHDWWYEMSDDHGVWRRGQDSLVHIRSIADTSLRHRALYEAYAHYMMRDGEMPEEPVDD